MPGMLKARVLAGVANREDAVEGALLNSTLKKSGFCPLIGILVFLSHPCKGLWETGFLSSHV